MKSLLLTGMFFVTSVFYAQEKPTNETVQDSVKKEKTTELKEVTIYGNNRQYLKVESDKTTINVRDNGMLNSGSSLEAVKKIPGVITSPSGDITINGKEVIIYIDGAPSSISGTDLQNYLATLPANAIEKVELIYNPGASYDAIASGSIINIVTSSKRRKGINASFNINYNFNKYQKPSPQILLNGKEKNLSWQTMIGYNYIDSENYTNIDQNFTSFTPNQHLIQKNLAVTTNRNFYFRTGTNYKLSEKSNLLFNYNMNLSNDRIVSEATTAGTGIDYFNNSLANNKNNNHELSLQFKTKLDTIGRTLDVTASRNFFDKKPNTISNGVNNNVSNYYNGNVDFKLANYYLKYDFAIPFHKENFSLNTGGKYNALKITDNGVYYLNTPTNSMISFNYTETNLAFYAEARKKIKKFSFTSGIRFEDYNVDRLAVRSGITTTVNFKNRNFFPNLSALYEINSNLNVSASYSKKIQQADYNTLDPNNFSSFDQYNSSSGNPLLNPTFFDNYELKFTGFQYVQLGGNYTISKDANRLIFDANPGELISNRTYKQFDKLNTMSIFTSFPIPLDYFLKGKEEYDVRKSNLDKMNFLFLNINYIRFDSAGTKFSFDVKPLWSYSIESQIILPWEIQSSAYYKLRPPGTYQIYYLSKTIQWLDISFNKYFLNKNLKINIYCNDLFNTNEINAIVSTNNLETNYYQKQDSRIFGIGLTFNFGNINLKKEDINIPLEKKSQTNDLLR